MDTNDIYERWQQKVRAEGEARGRAEGEALGRAKGEALGRAEGEARGRAEGEALGEARALLAVLSARGFSVSEEQAVVIRGCRDLEQLETWLRRAVSAASVDEVLRTS